MYLSFLTFIFTFIVTFILFLGLTFSGGVNKLATAVALHLHFIAASVILVWIILTFATSDIGKQHLFWVVYQSCCRLGVGGVVFYEDFFCLRCIDRLVVVTLGEFVLQLLHHIYSYSLVGSTQQHHTKVFYFCGFISCLLLWICQVFSPYSSSLESPGSFHMAHYVIIFPIHNYWKSIGTADF